MKNSDVLFQYRMKYNLTQSELAKQLNLNTSTISQIECDKYKAGKVVQFKIDSLKLSLQEKG